MDSQQASGPETSKTRGWSPYYARRPRRARHQRIWLWPPAGPRPFRGHSARHV